MSPGNEKKQEEKKNGNLSNQNGFGRFGRFISDIRACANEVASHNGNMFFTRMRVSGLQTVRTVRNCPKTQNQHNQGKMQVHPKADVFVFPVPGNKKARRLGRAESTIDKKTMMKYFLYCYCLKKPQQAYI